MRCSCCRLEFGTGHDYHIPVCKKCASIIKADKKLAEYVEYNEKQKLAHAIAERMGK